MEKKESSAAILTERDRHHEKLMVAVLRNLSDTPLVLKGGTALYLGYGLNRFSEDLDFDSAKKINLLNRIKSAAPQGISIDHINVKKDTETVSRYIVKYHVKETGKKDTLKLEVSYRTPVPDEQVVVKDGIRFASVGVIIDNKLNAAFDGENTRTKGRDLFDLHFLAGQYPEHFNESLAERLVKFSADPDKLVSLYQKNVQADPLLNKIMDVEQVALEINEMAERIRQDNSYMLERVVVTSAEVSLQRKSGDTWQDLEKVQAKGMKAGIHMLGMAKPAESGREYSGEIVHKDEASVFQKTDQGLIRHKAVQGMAEGKFLSLSERVEIGQKVSIKRGGNELSVKPADASLKKTMKR